MKRILLATAVAAALASPTLAAESETVAYLVPEMTGCPSCPFIVQSLLSDVEGAVRVEAVFETGIATVEYDPAEATADDFAAALTENGYSFEAVAPEN